MDMEMRVGDITPMTSVNVMSPDGEVRMTYTAKKGTRMVFLFLGGEDRKGERPLDVFGMLNALGWTYEDSKDRVIFRVEAVHDTHVEAVIPSWRDEIIRVPVTRMKRTVVEQLKPGIYLLGLCNLRATCEEELCIARVNEVVDQPSDLPAD